MDCHFLLQGIFPTQGSNLGLLHCRQILYHLSQAGQSQMLAVTKASLSLDMPDKKHSLLKIQPPEGDTRAG